MNTATQWPPNDNRALIDRSSACNFLDKWYSKARETLPRDIMLFTFYNRTMMFSKVEVCEFLDNTNQNLRDRDSQNFSSVLLSSKRSHWASQNIALSTQFTHMNHDISSYIIHNWHFPNSVFIFSEDNRRKWCSKLLKIKKTLSINHVLFSIYCVFNCLVLYHNLLARFELQ